MIRLVLFTAAFWSIGVDRTFAAEAVVRSGEHGSFTRLVIDLPQQSSWELDQSARQVVLRIARGVTGFDVSQVFTRIDRRRLADLRSLGGSGDLVLDLGCECSTRAFLFGQSMLVVDISDASGPIVPAPAAQQTEQQGLRFGTVLPEKPTVDLPLFLPPRTAQTEPLPIQSPDLPMLDTRTANAVKAAEERLLRQLGRAATQGLLEPDIQTMTPRPEPIERAPREELRTVLEQAAAEEVPLRAVTSRDDALTDHLRVNEESLAGAACLPDAELAVADWGSDDFGAGLAMWRSKLYGEFDKIDPVAAIGMARHYLHYGFGAEARHSLSMQTQPQALLTILSRLVDGDAVEDAGPLLSQTVCDGAVALWAVLALPDRKGRVEIDDRAVVRHFSTLPVHLRKRLGPDLAGRLSAFGYRDAADMVMRRLDLLTQTESPEQNMAQARIAEMEGASDIAQAARQDVVEANGAQSAQALADMIAGELAAGREILPDTADLAAAFAYERRKEPEAIRLAWAEVQARAGAGQFALAFERLAALEAMGADSLSQEQIYDLLRENAPDTEFLTVLFPRLEQAAVLASKSANALAERLLRLGFPQQALVVLREGATGPDGRARRVLRAEIALSLERPRQAEAEILGLSGMDVDDLRMRAREFASNWSELDGAEDTALSASRQTAPQDLSDRPDPDGVLARNRALLDRSAETRRSLDQLLAAYPEVEAVSDSAQPDQ